MPEEKKAPKPAPQKGDESIVLDKEDEAILDAIWDQIAREDRAKKDR